MMCLELFAGTGSMGRAFERLGWTVVSVDICAKSKPTLVVDILQWDYTVSPRDFSSSYGLRQSAPSTP